MQPCLLFNPCLDVSYLLRGSMHWIPNIFGRPVKALVLQIVKKIECLQNVTLALQASQEDVKGKGDAMALAEAKSKIKETALVDNLSAMRAERDSLAELTVKLEKRREMPAGMDASGACLNPLGLHSTVQTIIAKLCEERRCLCHLWSKRRCVTA